VLAEAVDIRRWLREDRRTPDGERLARDRAIGRELQAAPGDLPARGDVGRILGWWRRVPQGAERAEPSLGARVEAARLLGSAALFIVGALLGAGVAAVAFAYDGRSPINLFALLGVLVGLPLVLLVFTLLLLPGRLPGLRAVQGVAAGLNAGRWFGTWLDRLLGAELFAPRLLAGGAASAFSRWQFVVFSQWLALGFFAGALAVALLRVTFTDLAFGWGTTLQMDPERVHTWTRYVSAPWAPWLPQAVPDGALVEASRIYRLEQGRLPPERVELLGRWWPFVLMTLLVYGALPRLLLMLVGSWRLRRATRDLLRNDPEVTALLDRLDAPLVRLERQAADEAPSVAGGAAAPPPREAATAQGLLLLVWNGAVTVEHGRDWLAANLGVDAAAVADVNILQREAERRAALAAARGGVKPAVRRVIVLTKGWEPPLLEFADFLGVVRDECGADCSITVVPLDVSGSAVPAAGREVWARALARVADPRLYVVEAST
jgi:MFS family permease